MLATVTLASNPSVFTICAEAVGVAPRTFFDYFSSKEEALVGRDPEEIGRLRAALEERLRVETPLEALRGVLVEMGDYLTAHRGEWLARLSVVRSELNVLAAQLAAWAERELAEAAAGATGTDAASDLYPRPVVGAAMRWRDGNGTEPLADLIQGAFDALAAALPSPGAR